jgi:putative membrane protein
MSHNKTALISLLIASALSIPALGQAQTPPPPAPAATPAGSATLSKADQKAINDMAISNMAEIATGKMAVAKSQNPQVKAYAQKMIDEHTAAQADVTALAQGKGLPMPTDLDMPHKATSAMLDKLSGDAFDKAYMKTVGVTDHNRTHKNLASAISNAKDPDIKAAATKMLPVVDQHLQMAKQQASTAGGGSK